MRKYGYKVEYLINDDGDTTILNTKKSLAEFEAVVNKLGGSVLRVRRVIIAD